MTREAILELLNELKEASTENETLISALGRIDGDEQKRQSIVSEIETLTSRQSDIMTRVVALCQDNDALDKFRKLSVEKSRLFQLFVDTNTEKELAKTEKNITENLDKWIVCFQNIVTEILKDRK